MRFDVAQRKTAVTDTKTLAVNAFCVHHWPRRTDIVIAEIAKVFQLVGEHERVQLMDQNVVVAVIAEHLVKFREHHQLIVSANGFKELRRKTRKLVARLKEGKIFVVRQDEY